MGKGVEEALCGELKGLGVAMGVAEVVTAGNAVRNRLPGAKLHVLSCCCDATYRRSGRRERMEVLAKSREGGEFVCVCARVRAYMIPRHYRRSSCSGHGEKGVGCRRLRNLVALF